MKSVLVTGVCGGIGRALVNILSRNGWTVYGTDIDSCDPDPGLKAFWRGDIAEESFWINTVVPGVQQATGKLGLNGLVHNAAVQPCGSILEMPIEDWDRAFGVNLRAAFLGVRHLVPLMSAGDASIVNVASVHALATSGGMAAYVSSKGGLVAFGRAAALELASLNIRVNSILPGATDTPMLRDGFKRNSQDAVEAEKTLINNTPLKRLARPEEIAKAILFLLDNNQTSFMTGQTLVVDGGAVAQLSTE